MTPYEEIMLFIQKIECYEDNNKRIPLKELNVITNKHLQLILSHFGVEFIRVCRDDYQSWTILQKERKWKFLQCALSSN